MSIPAEEADAIVTGTHSEPFSRLGLHLVDGKLTIRAFVPDAETIDALDAKTGRKIVSLKPVAGASGLFEGVATRRKNRFAYRLRVTQNAQTWAADDPYRFGPVLGDIDEYLIGEGSHQRLWMVLGAHVITHVGVAGTHFAVWAPNALRVSVVGDFNVWDGRRSVMRRRGTTGVWEIFVPGIGVLSGAGASLLPPV